MRFGICAPPASLTAVAAAGFGYLEPAVTAQLQPGETRGRSAARACRAVRRLAAEARSL